VVGGSSQQQATAGLQTVCSSALLSGRMPHA